MNKSDFVSYRDALDIVFSNRNRAYGAYALRRAYPNHLGRAFLIGVGIIGGSLLLPTLLRAVRELAPAPATDIVHVTGDVFIEIPPAVPQPPKPPTPPPPQRSTIAFVPPLVVDDNTEERTLIAVDSLLNAKADISTKTQIGDPELPPAIDEVVFNDNAGKVETQAKAEPEKVWEDYNIHKKPGFPGGEAEMYAFLKKNIIYPQVAIDNGIRGIVPVSFVINPDGSVSDVTILNDIGGGCGKEAIRVVKQMPKWSPGEANGKAVRVRQVLPVRFRLD